ncbi:unnamed protein product [Brachionus calyciflorus]|uniref:Uncharacterized protein n=1 Tax=Brachionus calyciflorus TaxID=104777 RepID=A0A813Y989_9BILA|nr:unnamed protein product [Brachionus calyciflorus]
MGYNDIENLIKNKWKKSAPEDFGDKIKGHNGAMTVFLIYIDIVNDPYEDNQEINLKYFSNFFFNLEIPCEINVLNPFATFNSKPIDFNKSENEIFIRDEEQFSKQNVINVFTEKKNADDLNNTTPQPSVNKLSQSKMSNITYNQKEKVETNEEFLKRTVFDQDKQQNPNEELQKQKRIEAITKLLKSDLLDSFKDTTIFKTNTDSLNKLELDSKNENFSNLNFDKKQNLDLLSTNRLKISQGNDSNVPNLTINSKSINVSNYGHNTIEKNNISEAIKLSPNEFKQNLSKLESYSASSNFDSFYQPQNDLNQQRNSNLNQMVINSNLKNLSNSLNDNNSIDLRKKLQDHLNQKKTSFNPPLTNNNINNNNIYSMNNQQITSNSIFMKNQSLNIAVVSPVISNQNSQVLYQNNLETKDTDQKTNFLVSENNLTKDLDLNSEYINRGYPKNSVSNNTSSQNQSNFHFNYENQKRSIHSFKSETQNNFYLDKNANNFHKYPTVQNPIQKNENYFSNQNTISLQPSQQTLTTTTVTVTTKHYPTVGTVQPYSSPIINYNSLHNMNMNSPNVNYDKNLISNNVSNINNKSEIFASNNVKNDYMTNNYNTSFVIPQNKIDQRDNFHVYYDQTKSIEGFGNFGNSPKEKRIINQKNLDEKSSIEINTNINLNLNIPNNENPDLRNNISEQAKLNTSILSPNYSNISLLKKLQPESANSSDKNIYLSGNSDYLFNNVNKIDQTDRQNLQSVDIVPNFNKTNISELNEKPISEYTLYPNIRNENPHSHFIINNKSNNSYVMENKSSSFPSRMNSCNFTSSFDNNSKNSSQLNQVNNYYSSNLNNQNDINKNNYLDQNFVSHELSQNINLLGVSSGCFKAESSLNTTSISNDIHVRSITDENRSAEPFDGIKTSYNEQNQYPAETNNFDYFEEDILNENLEFLENLLID